MTPLARDRYPSRRTSEVTLLDRRDPVVHGRGGDGPLTEAQLETFAEQGWLVVEDAFDAAEVERMAAELDRLVTDPDLRVDDRTVVGTSGEVRSVLGVHDVSETFARIVADPRVADTARQVLGSAVYLHQTRVSSDRGFAGPGRDWRADFEGWHVEDGMPAPRAVSASVALTDDHPFTGAAMVMPGSHRTYVTCVADDVDDHLQESLRDRRSGGPDDKSLTILADRHGIEVVTPRAGSVVLYDANCLRAAMPNITPCGRATLSAVYNSVDNALQAPFGPAPPRPGFVASRDTTPVP